MYRRYLFVCLWNSETTEILSLSYLDYEVADSISTLSRVWNSLNAQFGLLLGFLTPNWLLPQIGVN